MIASGACLSRDIKAACLGIYVRVALQATSLGALTQDTSQVRRRRANSCVTAGEWSRPDMGKAQADAAFEECCGTCRLPTWAALLSYASLGEKIAHGKAYRRSIGSKMIVPGREMFCTTGPDVS